MAGCRHLEWEFYTFEEMKRTQKAVQRFGFVEVEILMDLIPRLSTLRFMNIKLRQASQDLLHMAGEFMLTD